MLQFQYDTDILTQVVSLLAPYDPGDLLETVAGLQLLPENADRTIRLEALAHTVASLANTQGKPTIGLPRLNQIAASGPLGQGPIASQEDPFNASFTEAFLFHGGTYVVFPGIAEDSTFITRHPNRRLLCSVEEKQAGNCDDGLTGLLAYASKVRLKRRSRSSGRRHGKKEYSLNF